MKIVRCVEFEEWAARQPPKIRAMIEARIFRIQYYDHFGDAKRLQDRLGELRWKNGLRIYFVRVDTRKLLLLHGGEKNGQKKDIKKARLLLERYTDLQA